MTDDAIISDIISREGRTYTDFPGDKGGPTKFGITLKTLADWRHHACEPVDVQNMDEAEARAIYADRYIHAPGFHQILDDRLRALVVDCGVNSGTATACCWLQKVLGVYPDGVFGPATLGALSSRDVHIVYTGVCAQRLRFLGRVITDSPTNAQFAAGWLNRVAAFLEG